MGLHALFFYIFAFVAVASAFMVIWAKNPVHSVLFLIVVFVNAAALFILAGAEYLGLLLLVVYVGAVAVLFLFVVMMLDIDFAELRSGILHYAPVGALIGIVLLAELIVVVGGTFIPADIAANTAMPMPADTSSVKAIGDVIYTHYAYFFQVAGLILLVAMIGAIVLTLKHRPDVKRQNIAKQVARTPESAHETVKVKPGQGI
ncbi:NADH-quinone oxidoreductase subunit J [Martelella mediterranea]|uniref:NADH-quinone oxidoreductase subunit J n=1 Tax=Martelella mediterranea DSM 17316 TaxID=1122214 RepID=A0A1U9Z4J7_9HYPH|nr:MULTISPECIES: NADH-quinone oxidoreductase subunit J [Martelella]AQZ52635.1 NADH-quinone oxidoreductase subunit J [Martelella mediterranea DSM 17316]MAU19560.1 NADH:ubiquinone oxidoreductase subunit J [Martelella sp.]MCD1634565.1 NADH-quinone oxidoreductase subunit J [Martelella mediterranea]